MTELPDLRAMLQALADVLPAFEAGTADDFGRWEPMREVEPGVKSMPYVTYGELEAAFRRAAAGWVRPDIAWPAWASTPDGQALQRDPARLEQATPRELAHLLTTVIRGDRFNEGLLLNAFERGILTGIARRAAVLASDPAALEQALALDDGAGGRSPDS